MNKLKEDVQKYAMYFGLIVLVIIYFILKKDPYTHEVYDQIDTIIVINKNEISKRKCKFIKNQDVSLILDKEGTTNITPKAFDAIKLKTIENNGNSLVVRYVNNVDNFTIGHQSLLYPLTTDYINIDIYFCKN